jgi:hypothetical protein
MDTRRYLNESRLRALAQFRWLGWVMLMMSVLVQVAMGASPAVGCGRGPGVSGAAVAPDCAVDLPRGIAGFT